MQAGSNPVRSIIVGLSGLSNARVTGCATYWVQLPTSPPLMRVSYKGITLDCQSRNAGSLPSTRSNIGRMMNVIRLSLIFILLASQVFSQTESGWDVGSSRSRVFVIPGDKHFADVCFENKISSSLITHLEKLVFKGVEINVLIEHSKFKEPDRMTVSPIDGFNVIPETIVVKEFETACIRIEEQLLGYNLD